MTDVEHYNQAQTEAGRIPSWMWQALYGMQPITVDHLYDPAAPWVDSEFAVKRVQRHLLCDVDGKIGPETRGALMRYAAVRRALAFIGSGKYRLGAGAPHTAGSPLDAAGESDCSGFVCWAMQRPRHDRDRGVWYNTDQMETDARAQVRGDRGEGVEWTAIRPGDILVTGRGRKVGHCGIVTSVRDVGGPATVVHCRARTPAIAETGVSWFRGYGAVGLRWRWE